MRGLRISMPAIPLRDPNLAEVPPIPFQQAADALSQLLVDGQGKTLLLTGAGISVASGVRAYRGKYGSYTAHKTYRPIFYSEFVASGAARQRYWARSYLGYPPVQVAEPNPSHYAVAAMKRMGYISSVITQNVDRLHQKAFKSQAAAEKHVLDLHGSLKHVVCLNCKTISDRDAFQGELSDLNPEWAEYARETIEKGIEPKSNPDGDVDLQNRSYDTFKLPNCTACGSGPLKPAVVFFGENISQRVKETADSLVNEASALVVIGSSLATYSAFRLLKAAKDRGIPTALLNIGPSRGDPLIKPEFRFDMSCTDLLRQVGINLASTSNDATALQMLRSGKIKATSKNHPAAS